MMKSALSSACTRNRAMAATKTSAACQVLKIGNCDAGSRKTVEGTAGGIAATLAAWVALLTAAGGGTLAAAAAPGAPGWARLAAATAAACLLEASTTQLDNVFVPLHLFSLLCLL